MRNIHFAHFGDKLRFSSVSLAEGSNLSEHLTPLNSPILFGCRTGICGTCLVEIIEESGGSLHPKTPEEEDLLPLLAPSCTQARLACQIRVSANLTLRRLEQE